MNKAPLLFDDTAEPLESERYIKQLQAEQAFSIEPNAGQKWQIRVGKDQDGNDVWAPVTIVAVANSSPGSTEPKTIVFRNSKKELKTWLFKDWIDEDTFFLGHSRGKSI